jgi:hypothetical protein
VTRPSRIFKIIRTALDEGQTVQIDGLGSFEGGPEGYRFVPQTEPIVFIAYVVEELATAQRLCTSLRSFGISPWLDKERLLPGQDWPRAIERAIGSASAFLPCFSARAVSKRGGFQAELRYALDCARSRPLDDVFLIPVRLDACEIPAIISSHVQYVDLFPDWPRGVRRIARAILKADQSKPRPGFVRI